MKLFRRRERGPQEPVRVKIDAVPEIRHVVEHKPYPRPTSAVIVFTDFWGQDYYRYPVQVRGGTQTPPLRMMKPPHGDLENVTVHIMWDYDR